LLSCHSGNPLGISTTFISQPHRRNLFLLLDRTTHDCDSATPRTSGISVRSLTNLQSQRTPLSITSRRRPTRTGTASHKSTKQPRKKEFLMTDATSPIHSIKKPKTNRYPSLNGTDPKFRRNHRHALHGTMKALVRFMLVCRDKLKLRS